MAPTAAWSWSICPPMTANQARLAVAGGESRMDSTGTKGWGSGDPKNSRPVMMAPRSSQ